MTRAVPLLVSLGLLAAAPAPAAGQAGGNAPSPAPLRWEPLSNEGVLRATAQVDSVFIERSVPRQHIGGGDWVSYLAARLGVVPIPEDLTIRVAVDSTRILVDGQLRDLPPETRASFGPLAMLLDSTTTLRAEVVPAPSGPGHVRFVLKAIYVNGFAIPEALLAPVLAQVGKQYPVLTESGRQLFIAIPDDGRVTLGPNAILVETRSP